MSYLKYQLAKFFMCLTKLTAGIGHFTASTAVKLMQPIPPMPLSVRKD